MNKKNQENIFKKAIQNLPILGILVEILFNIERKLEVLEFSEIVSCFISLQLIQYVQFSC